MGVTRKTGRVMAALLALSLMTSSALAATDPSAKVPEAEPDKQAQPAESMPEEQTITFTDLGNSYARDAVYHLTSLGLISGQGGDLFHPQESISRQDVFVLLSKAMGVQPKLPREHKFDDVSQESAYAPYIYGLAELGVLNGRSDGTLGAKDALTRQELAVILDRLWKAGSGTKQVAEQETYADQDEIADYAKEAVASVTAQGWMKGANGVFRPQGQVTRADAALIAERVWTARYQLAEKADFTVNKTKLTVMAGTSEQVEVTRPGGGALPFTPVFAFDQPTLGVMSPDGTFTAGPTPGKGILTVSVGLRSITLPVEITPAPVDSHAGKTADLEQGAEKEKAETSTETKTDSKTDTKADTKTDAGTKTDTKTDYKADVQTNASTSTPAADSASKEKAEGTAGKNQSAATDQATTNQTASDKDGTESVDHAVPDEEEEEQSVEAADELVNLAPGSFTSVKPFGKEDAYFREVEKQYPGPVGGLVTPSDTWTGYNRQFGRKVTVVLPEPKQLERVALTFRHAKSSGITIPEWMDVEVSPDGKAWYFAGKAKHDISQAEDAILERTLAVTLPQVETRYVRVSFPVKVFAFARQLEVWGRDGRNQTAPSVLLPFANQADPQAEKKNVRRVENMLLAYTGDHGQLGTWTKEDFLPMVGYRTKDGYMRDQMFDTILFLPYQTMPATKEKWLEYQKDLFASNQQLEALNDAMREFNRLRGTLYANTYVENVVLALPYPNGAQTDFGKLDPNKESLSFSAKQVGEEKAYQNRKQALEWYYSELKKRWDQAGFQYLKLDGIYWFHELVEDSGPRERDLIRDMGRMVHEDSLRYYWIPYFGAPGLSEWKSLYFDAAFLQPSYYSDKPIPLDRIEGTLEVIQKYGMDVEIEGDAKMYNDPKFLQIYYNQLIATHRFGMDKNNIHAYYFGSKTLLHAVNSDDPVIRGIYDDTYKWMRGKFDQTEYMLPSDTKKEE
ncbi:DUF4855 domain-containing protein [Brevibacillus ruminantium]|uniref:DUF4855 domain-containing protein n=1 Tax=Brevibacillus ruminantium TaxID=2950604 RepID=A0ABY4WHI8_9BACL|nr:DUF4855 domain-containing protein [Brevibacillus ruminantium]USG65492.1 DUF4855 domain-containing protein [Brevibacillus ruminantium]